MDPTAYLPVELTHNIFSHLPPSELFTLRRVCKTWNRHLSSTYLELIVNRSIPFASTAKDLPERLQRRKNFQSGAPRVYEIAADGYDDATKAHTFVGSKQVIFSAGYLGVVRNWDSMKFHDGDKQDPATLEIWNLAAGGRNEKPVAVLDLPGLFPEDAGKMSLGLVWIFGEVHMAVVRVDKTDDDTADEFFRGFAVVDLKTGNIISKWSYAVDEPQAELVAPHKIQCNGKEILACWSHPYDDLEYVDVHDIETGKSLRWEEIEESDACNLTASAIDKNGTCYILATDAREDLLGVRIFNARDANAPERFVPMKDVFGVSRSASLRNVSVELVGESLYFKAAYTDDPKVRWNNREKTTWFTLLAKVSNASLSPYRALPATFPAPTVVSKVENSCFHDLTFVHDKMTIWGYSVPGFSPEEPQTMRLAHYQHASTSGTGYDTSLEHHTIDAITLEKKSKIRGGDDEAIVFYPRGERPRRDSYSYADGEKHPALLLDFGRSFQVPEKLGREVDAETFKELCKPVKDEDDEESEDSEESSEDHGEEQANSDSNEAATEADAVDA